MIYAHALADGSFEIGVLLRAPLAIVARELVEITELSLCDACSTHTEYGHVLAVSVCRNLSRLIGYGLRCEMH